MHSEYKPIVKYWQLYISKPTNGLRHRPGMGYWQVDGRRDAVRAEKSYVTSWGLSGFQNGLRSGGSLSSTIKLEMKNEREYMTDTKDIVVQNS